MAGSSSSLAGAASSNGYSGPALARAARAPPPPSSSSEEEEEEEDFKLVRIEDDIAWSLPRTWRKWRKFIATCMIVVASRAQWGCLGNWLKNFRDLKPLKDRT